MTNKENIQSMSTEELASFLMDSLSCSDCPCSWDCGGQSCGDLLTNWLESEVEE